MRKRNKFWIQFFVVLALTASTQLFVACAGESTQEAIIEETEGGLELLENEFAACEGVAGEPDVPFFLRDPSQFDTSNSRQASMAPHIYSSLNKMYPSRGSWRKSKKEILDLVDRYVWSPEEGRGVRLLLSCRRASAANRLWFTSVTICVGGVCAHASHLFPWLVPASSPKGPSLVAGAEGMAPTTRPKSYEYRS